MKMKGGLVMSSKKGLYIIIYFIIRDYNIYFVIFVCVCVCVCVCVE